MGACGSKKDTVAPVQGSTQAAAAAQPAAAATPAAAAAPAGKKLIGGDYTSADQLFDYSTFFTDAAKSSLKRNLTEAIWNEYKDASDNEGVTFKTMVFSGIMN